jgi:hypothetical protein
LSEAGEATFNGDIRLNDGNVARFGTDQDFRIGFNGTDAVLQNVTSDSDITFLGNDGGSTITALTLDMSNAGQATFNAGITATTGTFSSTLFSDTFTAYSGGAVTFNAGATSGFVWINAGTLMTLDASGNLGLGVVPSAWSVAVPALQLGTAGAFLCAQGATEALYLGSNAYYNGTNWIYAVNAPATYYRESAGAHAWFNAPSGTAGDPITFTQAMTLDASGNVGIGTSSPTAPLTVNGGTASAATIQLGNHNDNASIHGKYSLSFKADSTEAIADRSISFAIGTAANFALTTSTAIFNDLGANCH